MADKKDEQATVKNGKWVGTTIAKCDCSHEFQDSFYGLGLRVMNQTGNSIKPPVPPKFRCTVCGKNH